MPTALVISPHPDDAEIAMGGTIAAMKSAGSNVIIAELTDGEPTPLGSKETRLAEAIEASEILKVERLPLGMANRRLQADHQNRLKLAELIRQVRPNIIFAPVAPDQHPDHIEAAKLIHYARFDAKLHKTNIAGEPHWVEKLFSYYSPHRYTYDKPSFIVDITSQWQTKLAAVGAYKSQVAHISPSAKISVIEKIEIVNRFFGMSIGADFGEPFLTCQPMKLTCRELF